MVVEMDVVAKEEAREATARAAAQRAAAREAVERAVVVRAVVRVGEARVVVTTAAAAREAAAVAAATAVGGAAVGVKEAVATVAVAMVAEAMVAEEMIAAAKAAAVREEEMTVVVEMDVVARKVAKGGGAIVAAVRAVGAQASEARAVAATVAATVVAMEAGTAQLTAAATKWVMAVAMKVAAAVVAAAVVLVGGLGGGLGGGDGGGGDEGGVGDNFASSSKLGRRVDSPDSARCSQAPSQPQGPIVCCMEILKAEGFIILCTEQPQVLLLAPGACRFRKLEPCLESSESFVSSENNAHLSKAVMLYTLTMTSDVSFFNATVRGLVNKKQVAVARRRHGLQTMDGVMPIPRKPSEAEHEAIRGRLMSALGTVLEEHCVQTWLGAELGAAIAALKSSGASSLSPRQKEARRPMAGPPRTLGAFELVCSRDHWRLIHPSWSVSITMNHQFLSKPSNREQNQVHELLGRLLVSHVPTGCCTREEARELLEITLLRLQLREPPQLSLKSFLESSPQVLWFTVDVGAAALPSDDKDLLLEPSLLDDARWLEDNELSALAARVMLGSTVAEVQARLSDASAAELSVSNELRGRLAREQLPVPRQRAAQLVVLAGGAPAMGFLDGAIATAGFAECFHRLNPAVALDGVVSNTAAREYYELREPDDSVVRIVPPDAYVRCVAAKNECFHGFHDSSYVDQLFVPMLEATLRDLECEPPPSQGSLKPPPLPARAHRHSPRISGPARSGVATDAAPSFAAATAVPGRDWAAGTFHALLGRELMDTLRAAETLTAAICAAINLFVLLSNAYNTDGIELALGAGTARLLNAHATGHESHAGARDIGAGAVSDSDGGGRAPAAFCCHGTFSRAIAALACGGRPV